LDASESRRRTAAEFLSGDLSTIAGIAAVAQGVRAWRPELHGVMHAAMAAFKGKQRTAARQWHGRPVTIAAS